MKFNRVKESADRVKGFGKKNCSGGRRRNDDPLAARIEIPLLGIEVTPLSATSVALAVSEGRGKRLLLNHNLHSVYVFDSDDKFRQLYRDADWIVIDGAPIRWLASLTSKRKLDSVYRIGSTDWIAALNQIEVPKRLFVFGATEESNAGAIQKLEVMLPHWTTAGLNGYVQDETAVAQITAFKPDLVLIGLGMPQQEHFLIDNLSQLPDAIYATVGGAIDYLSGTTRLAPRWMGRFGLEWVWRLLNQPRRLAYRYLVEPVKLLARLLRRGVRRLRAPAVP